MSVEREMSLAEWCAKLPSLHLVNQELSTLYTQLAALAEQNEKLRDALEVISCNLGTGKLRSISERVADEALSLPDLASPVLNKYRAEGMKEAEKIVRKRGQWVSNGQGIQYRSTAPESISAEALADEIRARAAELENEDAN